MKEAEDWGLDCGGVGGLVGKALVALKLLRVLFSHSAAELGRPPAAE